MAKRGRRRIKLLRPSASFGLRNTCFSMIYKKRKVKEGPKKERKAQRETKQAKKGKRIVRKK